MPKLTDDSELQAKQAKFQAAFEKTIDELYDFNGRFFADMSQIQTLMTPEFRASLSSQDLIDLELLLLPFQKLENFLIKSDREMTNEERIQDVLTQFQSEAFQKSASVYLDIRAHQAALNAFMQRLGEKATGENKKILRDIGSQVIKPVQNFARLELHLKTAMKQSFAKLNGIDVKEFDAYIATAKKNEKLPDREKTFMPQLAFLNQHRDADLKSLLKFEQMINMNTNLQLASNATADVDIFKLAESERARRHKETTTDLKKATLEDLTQQMSQMFQMGRDIEKALSNDDKLQVIMIKFADAYIDERSQGLFSTKRGPFLQGLMNSIIAEFKLTTPADKTQEEVIFEYTGKSPKVSALLVAHLYKRAISEGVHGVKDQHVFTNAVKAVVRMGNDAIKIWNKIALENSPKYGGNLGLPLTKLEDGAVKRMKEREIDDLYASKLKNTPKEIASRYHPNLLVTWLSKAVQPPDLSPQQYAKINVLIGELQRAEKHYPEKIHQIFMNEYFDTYILERVKEGSHSKPGKLQAFLESVATSGGKKADSALFETVAPQSGEAQSLALRAVTRGVESIINKNETQFINVLKAVKRMGVLSEWNELVNTGGYTDLALTEKMDLSEKGIQKLWSKVKDNIYTTKAAPPVSAPEPSVSRSVTPDANAEAKQSVLTRMGFYGDKHEKLKQQGIDTGPKLGGSVSNKKH